jgi:maleylpyruvate isomerase
MNKSQALASDADQLRSRLGKGARFDAEGAPADALRLARHGMAFFARHLNALSDDQLVGPSLVPGWTRAHVVAHVSIAARAQALAVTDLRGGPLDDEFDWEPDVDLTSTLPARALRHLYDHAHVHLNVEWRDLGTSDWTRTIAFAGVERFPVPDLPRSQAALLWWGAVALNAVATADEIPATIAAPSGPLAAIAGTKRPSREAGELLLPRRRS